VAATGAAAAGPAADTAHDGGGSAVISGFVDSHFDLVFAGDRAQEFAARMTSTPYSSGGIRTTVAATGGGEAEDSRPEAQGEKRS
jgi:imidazolonepropionase